MNVDLMSKRRVPVSLMWGAAVIGSAVAFVVPGANAKPVAPGAPTVAHAARTVSMREKSSMNAVGYHGGSSIYERGVMSGTYRGSVEARMVVVTNTTGEATFTVYTKGGWLKARATTHAYPETAEQEVGHFYGKLVVTGGYGVWAHASGTLAIYGSLNRRSLHATGEMDGTFHV